MTGDDKRVHRLLINHQDFFAALHHHAATDGAYDVIVWNRRCVLLALILLDPGAKGLLGHFDLTFDSPISLRFWPTLVTVTQKCRRGSS
jgi:hypothetical protein